MNLPFETKNKEGVSTSNMHLIYNDGIHKEIFCKGFLYFYGHHHTE